MKMGLVTAVLYIHMLLWAGCTATLSARNLRSDEILLSKAQPIKVFWRKLLQENASKPDVIKAETTNASGETESNSVDTQDALADVKKEDVVLDAKVDSPKTDSISSNVQQEDVKGENAAALTSVQNDATKEEGPKIEGASKEEVVSVATDNDTHTTETKEIEKTENPTSEAIAQSQDVQGEESSTPSTDKEKGVETEEKVREEDSGQRKEKKEAPGEKTDAKGDKNASNVDTQGKPLVEDVKEEVVAVAVAEEEKRDNTPKQKDATPGDVKTSEGDQQETPTEESGSVVNSTETGEKPTEDNPIKMVETDSDEKHTDSSDGAKIEMVQSGDKEQSTLDTTPASVEEPDSSNHTDDSNGEAGNPSDTKVDDEKREEKHDDNIEIAGKKGEENNTTKEVSQVQSDETAEEKQEASDDNTEPKDTASENKDTEEVSQVKSEEKPEENNEAREEKAEENHEPNEGNTEVKDKEGDGNDAEVSQVKPDDETQAAAKEVETQLEELKRDTVLDTTNDQRQERDPSDDEYDIIQEIVDLPTKFQQTAEKVADHLRPDLLRWSDTSKEYFNLANQQISESFSPLIGRQYAPFFASMISYGILLLPLIVVILLFEHIKALFSLQKVLLFINIYLAAYFATLWLASFIIGLEPMSFFYHNSLSSYLSLQLLQALGYVIYLILQTANMINSCSSDTRVGKVTSSLQWVVALGIGLHYYVTVFHPAVASKPPHTSWKFYAIYSAAFFILCLFARIRWVKKQYVSIGNDMANKKS